MRLLIVDGNRPLVWVVRRLVPGGVEVENATTREQVDRGLHDRPPDAVLLNVRRPAGPWREVAGWCQQRRPPIPVLFHTGASVDPDEVGIRTDRHSFFTESLTAEDLHRLLQVVESGSAASS